MKTSTKIIITVFLSVVMALTSGCLNMPTKPEKIAPSYVSVTRYKDFNCKELLNEKNALSTQENNLIFAQNHRVNNSDVQGLAFGFGQGDGIAASELANVKGRLVAVNASIKNKRCRQNKAGSHLQSKK
jgi:hypothetical protein